MWTDAAQLLGSRTAASSVIARKFATKLVQRIGLTFLPATVAAWRYQQTSVSINVSLSNTASDRPAAKATPTESSPPNSTYPADGNEPATTSRAAQTHESSAGAHGVTKDESPRPALQPSPLVNASPVTSPTSKAPAADRQHNDATSTLQGSQAANAIGTVCHADSLLQADVHDTATIRQTPCETHAAPAEANHEPQGDADASSADGDYAEDIPEEIEEVYTAHWH